MHFYDYFRSSAAYRCRIALNLKGLEPERTFVNLRTGEVRSDWYTKVNPQQLVPALVDGEATLTQSLAIIEYLDEVHPEPAFLPKDALGRARVRAISQAIACDIHPLNNLRILNYLTGELGQSEDAKNKWYVHWVTLGFTAIETQLAASADTGAYCHGDTVTMADICLVPQVFNARRFDVDMTPYPTIARIDAALSKLPAVDAAHPGKQPDTV